MSSDRRLLAANPRVAGVDLVGKVKATRFVEGETREVKTSVLDLCAAPEGPRDRQLLRGDKIRQLESFEGWSFVQSPKDGYVGYVPSDAIGPAQNITHKVTALATHLYAKPDMKTREIGALSLGAKVAIIAEQGSFFETQSGEFIPAPHLSPVAEMAADPVTIAEKLLGVPYLWGGNSSFGIDCSGLVQLGLLSAGISCPADSDMQQDLGVEASGAARRGDLYFWKGHVAMALGETTLIHANAFHMAVAVETIEGALARISEPLLARRRL